MDVKSALREAVKEAGWSTEQLAVESSASFGAARKWLSGETTPGGDSLVTLMRVLPGFARRLGFNEVGHAA